MKHLISTLLLAVSMALAAGNALASPIVANGSSYSLYLQGLVSGALVNLPVTFDGIAETFTRAGLTLTVNESDTDLGSGMHQILINLSANGDLYPSPGETITMSLGTDGNGLDLLSSVYLENAHIRLYTGDTLLADYNNIANDFRSDFFTGAWSGFFPAAGKTWGLSGAGGLGITGFQFEFLASDITDVPEPGSSLLIFAALLAMAAAAKLRRNGKAVL
ncbi:PEP-CTERM sorting domain-containing protein [Undibacterium sp.]|jgi:hypothetical protein|uniref:PEP-CTERM sorting domain-containing protein n=1 Tax=Undibacterium sp. TaxID=1914977 RepID=UPI002CEE44F9|nr:PEP-CTERM sorting domain-containing protein [Undibacterium sp.]HTD04183.1 PEP-CTERM sorting domain-containing protein [Undibacterium sp.]